MRAFFKNYRSSLIVITVLAATVVLLAYGAYHLSGMIREKAIALKQNKMDYALTQNDVQAITALREDRQYVDMHRTITDILLPNTDEEKVRLFATIEQLAKDSGNQDVTLAVKDVAGKVPQSRTATSDADTQEGATVAKKQDKTVIAPSSQDYMFVTVSVTGTYGHVLTFMSRVENMPYLADIMRVRFLKQNVEDMPKEAPSKELLPEDAPPLPIDQVRAEMDVAFYLAQ